MTIFSLIYWEKSKRFSLIVNSVKILSEKDKKIQREYKILFGWKLFSWEIQIPRKYIMGVVFGWREMGEA